jgi:hypothetical protein
MVEKPSHVKQLSLNHVRKIGLKQTALNNSKIYLYFFVLVAC